ncbi:papain family cysteine protease (macronuclear) [Tetrahymena thermophila SB210]|uniref:Papain family cysteine protease n=1 Tax=Tetrahymena thermophila (strain SB210) TaxID=312017 RepID=I7M4I2_TETTS|nr:papain family cysteine protease [Tetrahymena thermophila SB210]EAS07096.1 papain family cysteine protease [Tetrahymena thermophila SB210]|eukprot:XP_001027338.1 papain family cysteine protease [Tetrahymena thermophila SB210]
MNKTLIIAFVSILAISAFGFISLKENSHNVRAQQDALTLFKQFKMKYNKRYADPDFESYRFGVFSENLEVIKTDSTFGITQFMDLTSAEFSEQYLTLKVNKNQDNSKIYKPKDDVEIKEIDFTTLGKVTPVKDQGRCGSCYAFSTTGAIESALLISGVGEANTLSLSEQEIVDCVKEPEYNQLGGCQDGYMDESFKYIIKNKISKAADYPYTAVEGKCKDTSSFEKYAISSYVDVPSGDCKALLTALQDHPVSVAIDAKNLQYYTSGVYSNCSDNLTHAVLLVGYSSSALKLKNSWGTQFGENGYFRLAVGNTCGVCNAASFPVL